MEVEVLLENENELELKFKNSTVTIPSLLVALLQKNKDVEFAAFKIVHPEKDEVLLYIKTKSKSPRELLKKAIDESLKLFKTFKLQVEKMK